MSDSPIDPPIHRLHVWQFQWVRDLLWIVASVGLLYLGWVLQTITVPILVGLGLAYLFEPVIAWSTTRWPQVNRTRVVVGVLVLLLLFLVGLLAVVVPLAVGEAGELVARLPGYLRNLMGFLQSEDAPEFLQPWVERVAHILPMLHQVPVDEAAVTDSAAMSEAVVRAIAREELATQQGQGMSLSAIGNAVTVIGGFLTRVAVGFFDFVFTVFLVGFFFVVFSTTYPAVREFIDGLIPEARTERTHELLGKMDAAVSGFVRGRLLIALILGTVFAVGWTICGVPHAILLGMVVGIFTLVPYLSGIGLPIAWLLLTVATAGRLDQDGLYTWIGSDGKGHLHWVFILLLPSIVFVVAQLLDDYVLSPVIQGRATNLSPAAIIVAVLAGGSLAGLYGMLLAIPVAACIRILVVDVFFPQFQSWLRGEASDPLPIEN